AEDGIRDRTVTGVQTCALPICSLISSIASSRDGASVHIPGSSLTRTTYIFLLFSSFACSTVYVHGKLRYSSIFLYCFFITMISRSEERRVGKEFSFWLSRQLLI